MLSDRFETLADKWFGTRFDPQGRTAKFVDANLPPANRLELPNEFLSRAGLLALLVGAFGSIVISAAIVLVAQITWLAFLFLVPIFALIFGGMTFGAMLVFPYLQAAERGSNIDEHLPFALEYMSNIVGPGAPFISAVKRISSPQVYGQLAFEMQKIARDIEILGVDRTTAMAYAIDRSPSALFKETLQGISTTLAAGGNLAEFLQNKAAELFENQKTLQTRSLETLGVLAELFVVIAVATPLLLLILLVSVALFGEAGPEIGRSGFQLFTVLVPTLYAAFTGAIIIYKPTA